MVHGYARDRAGRSRRRLQPVMTFRRWVREASPISLTRRSSSRVGIRLQRPAEEEALGILAVLLLQERELREVLHAFSGHVDVQRCATWR